jgi:Cdc6-like AAA superfamily ATPase
MTDKTKGWSEFLLRLGNFYTVHQRDKKTTAGHKTFLVDLSEWKLRFSKVTPLIWVEKEAAERPAQEQFGILQDTARELGWRHRDCIVLLDGKESGLKSLARDYYSPRLVIIDANDQHIVLEKTFTDTLLDIICDQIPISDLAPYETSKPVTGTRFFGRITDIQKIFKKANTNFAVLGPRRIGKTSLLREVELRLKEQTVKELTATEGPYVFLDCSLIKKPDTFMEALVQKLQPKELKRLRNRTPEVFIPRFIDRMHKYHKSPVTIFLDEVDRWFAPKTRNHQLLDIFKVSSEGEACRYIVAGFTQLMQEPQLADSPFFKRMFERIELGPFRKEDVSDLLLKPMKHLRIHIDQEEDVVDRLYKETGGIPLLVQYYCLSLINQLDRSKDRRITPDNLASIREKPDFKTLVLGSIREAVDAKERSLVYALLKEMPQEQETMPFTDQNISAALKQNGLYIRPEEIDQICDRLILSGILANEGNKFKFSIPVFPEVLRGRGLNYLLSEAKKEMGL